MTPQEIERIERIERSIGIINSKINGLIDVYYRTHFIDKDIFRNPVVLKSYIDIQNKDGLKIGKLTDKIGIYGATPVTQADAITDPSGGATQDSEARDAIVDILKAIRDFGITL